MARMLTRPNHLAFLGLHHQASVLAQPIYRRHKPHRQLEYSPYSHPICDTIRRSSILASGKKRKDEDVEGEEIQDGIRLGSYQECCKEPRFRSFLLTFANRALRTTLP